MSDNSKFQWIEPRDPGRVNWYGLWTLYKKEVLRFLKFLQTVVSANSNNYIIYGNFYFSFG